MMELAMPLSRAALAASLRCSGLAAPYGALSHPDERGYRWRFAPGAFRRAANEPCRLWVCHHGERTELASTHRGTLRLLEDATGLHVEFTLPANQSGYDARLAIGRGAIAGLSVGMNEITEHTAYEFGQPLRVITFATLNEISLASSPRFSQTFVRAAAYRDFRDAAERHRINRFLSFS